MSASDLSRLSLDLLKTLVVFEETGLVEETATKLGISQAGVSLQLKKLEEQAGVPLFQPLGRRKALTEFARGLCRSIAPPLRDIDLRLQEASRFSLEPRLRTLRIGCRSDLMARVSGSLRFSGRMTFRSLTDSGSLRALKEGQIDLAIVRSDLSFEAEGLTKRTLFEDSYVLAFPAKWTEARTWGELRNDSEFLWSKPLAVREDATFLVKSLAKYFEHSSEDLQTDFVNENDSSSKELVQAGLAWAVLPELLSKGLSTKISIPDSVIAGEKFLLVARADEGRDFLKDLVAES